MLYTDLMMIQNNFRVLVSRWETENRGTRLTNAVLGERLGLSPTTISHWKNGKIRGADFDTLEAICDFFGVGVGDLLVYIPENGGGRGGEGVAAYNAGGGG